MGLGSYPFTTLEAIKGIVFHSLAKHSTTQIVDAGVNVIQAVEAFKEQHPDQISTDQISGGLLGDGSLFSYPLNDFEIATRMVDTNVPEMAALIESADGVPVLLAYLGVIVSGPKLPDEYFLASALPFAVQSLTIDSEEARRWHLELKEKTDATAKRIKERNALNAASPRLNGRAIDHDDVLNEYLRLVREGHTEREARGILVQRGTMGSQSTIYRITKEK